MTEPLVTRTRWEWWPCEGKQLPCDYEWVWLTHEDMRDGIPVRATLVCYDGDDPGRTDEWWDEEGPVAYPFYWSRGQFVLPDLAKPDVVEAALAQLKRVLAARANWCDDAPYTWDGTVASCLMAARDLVAAMEGNA